MADFGIVGAGLIAAFHAKAIDAIEGAKVAGVCSRSKEKAEALAREHGARACTDLDDLLSDPNIHTLLVTTPSGAHAEPAIAAAKAGKNVIVEKPIEVTLKRADAIIEAHEKAGTKLAVIFQSRFKEGARTAKRAVDEKRLGTLAFADAYVKWYRKQAYYSDSEWHGTRRLDGGGALINQSIHAVDLLLWLAGNVKSVSALADVRGHTGLEVEDTAAALLRFESGAIGVIQGSTACYPGALKRIELAGNRGSIVLEEDSIRKWDFAEAKPEDEEIRKKLAAATTTGGGASDPAAISFEGHKLQIEDFLSAIEENRPPLVDGPEGRRSLELVLAIYRSAGKGGVPVRLT